jgi:hypothetical protein
MTVRSLGWFTASTIKREEGRPVIAAPSQQSDARGIAPGHKVVAVVLDLVRSMTLPAGARRRTERYPSQEHA